VKTESIHQGQQLNMNLSTRRKLLIATMTAVLSSTTFAGLPAFGGLPDFTTLIQHRAQAEKLPVGTKVALACKVCQGRNIQTVDKKKTFLAWFDPNATQKCDGCGGAMQMRRNPHGNHNTHVCSKCGENSAAAVCAPMRKKAKS